MNTGNNFCKQGSEKMRNITYKISISVMMIVIFITSLTGCSSSNRLEQETIQITTKGITHTVIEGTTKESLAGWQAAYKTVISDTLKECKEKYPNEINHGGYGLYDFDNDSIPELFLEVYGSTTPDYYIHIYDYEYDKAFLIDSIQSAHFWVYGTNKENSFLTEISWMGVSVWNIYELKNRNFVSEKLASYYPDGFSDSIEPQDNPLPGMGYEIEEIKYYFLDDLSGINNFS